MTKSLNTREHSLGDSLNIYTATKFINLFLIFILFL